MVGRNPAFSSGRLLNGCSSTVRCSRSTRTIRSREAVAIGGGRIVAVGLTADIQILRSAARPRSSICAGGRRRPASSTRTSTSPRSTRCTRSSSATPAIKNMDDVLSRVAAQVAKTQARRMGAGTRLGRRQAGRAPLHHRRRSRQGRAEQPGLAEHTTGHYGVGEQLRDEDGRGPEGHARSAGRHDRSRRAGRADRRDEGSRAGARHAARAAVHARTAEGTVWSGSSPTSTRKG